MSILWAVYAVFIAGVLGLGACAAERGLRSAGLPGRGVWVAAIVGSWIVPALALLGVVGTRLPWTRPNEEILVDLLREARVASGHAAVGLDTSIWSAITDPAVAQGFLWLWAAGTLTAATIVGVSVTRLFARARRWSRAELLGERVRVAPDFGPAVLGVARPFIVIPQWAFEVGVDSLRMILTHEREHRAARDTLVTTLCTCAAIAAPWNVPLWWHLRRLRLAVELDCDQRVLRSGASASEYGRLLLHVGSRGGVQPLTALGLTESPSLLERRIQGIVRDRTGRFGWKSATALAVSFVSLGAAAVAPTPPGASKTQTASIFVSAEELSRVDSLAREVTIVATGVRVGSRDGEVKGQQQFRIVRAESDSTSEPGGRVTAVLRSSTPQAIYVDGAEYEGTLEDLVATDIATIEFVSGDARRSATGSPTPSRDVISITTRPGSR